MRLLTKNDIYTILSNRFRDEKLSKLSLIPTPDMFKDIKKASKRVIEAIKKRERILIVGDYDVDGVVSSVILSQFFNDLNVRYKIRIPNRFNDGYGINKKIINEYDADLIITVDNGISAFEASKICKKRNIDLIITDHHTPQKELPEAFAIINPKQNECSFPYQEICGAHIAWYFIASIKQEMNIEYNISKFLDILSIAIVADMMELVNLNRIFVKKGLNALNNSNRPFVKAMKIRFNKRKFTFSDISFLIAPLINSSGRIEDAIASYHLLMSDNFNNAVEWLNRIIEYNEQRKVIEKELFNKSIKQIGKNEKAIVVWGENWHEGVIGIVASRLSKKYHKPAFVFSINGNIAKGSVRSVGKIDILKIIEETKELLIGYGGHKQAAGVKIDKDKLITFKREIYQKIAEIEEEDFFENSNILGQILPDSVDLELSKIIEMFEPYGQSNPTPEFLLKDVKIGFSQIIGKTRNHQKLGIISKNGFLETLNFNFEREIKKGDSISFIATIGRNDFNNIIRPQLLIKEILI